MTQSCSDTVCRQQQLSLQPCSKQLPLQGTPFTRSLLQTVQASVLLRSPGNNCSSNISDVEQFRKESCWGWTSLAI